MKFSIKDLFSKCEAADLVTFTEETLMENIIFFVVLVSVIDDFWNRVMDHF